MSESIDPSDDGAHVQNEGGNSTLSTGNIDSIATNMIIEIKHGHMSHLKTIMIVSILIGLCRWKSSLV